MYVLPPDVVAGSMLHKCYSRLAPSGEGLREIVGEGPILWLLMIQVHAQLGAGLRCRWARCTVVEQRITSFSRDGVDRRPCSASSIMNSFATEAPRRRHPKLLGTAGDTEAQVHKRRDEATRESNSSKEYKSFSYFDSRTVS